MITPNNSISIIIISYNTCDITLRAIQSVFDQTKTVNFEIIVFDNCSKDGSAEKIQDTFGNRLKLIKSEQNIGFAAGNNRATQFAKNNFLLLLNPDTIVLDNAIDNLVAFATECPRARIWGGRTLFEDFSLNKTSCWSKQSLWSLVCQSLGLNSIFRNSTLFNPEGIGSWNREGIREVDIVSGCFLLIKKDFWEMLDGFSEKYFMYGEEADLCLRAKKLGACPTVNSSATIVHMGGASETSRSEKLNKLIRSKNMLIDDHFGKSTRGIAKYLLNFWPVSRYFAHSILYRVGRKNSFSKKEIWKEVCNFKNA